MWNCVKRNGDGTYSLFGSGKKVRGPLEDLLREEINAPELLELIEKTYAQKKISKEEYEYMCAELLAKDL